MPRISISEPVSEAVVYTSGSAAPRLDAARVTLRFRLSCSDDRSLDALRYARRAMLREEWTLGVDEDEPSLEEAVFSASDIAWSVPVLSRARCRKKLEELVARANRALADESAAGRSARAPRPRTP
jgi:hypothetical protein